MRNMKGRACREPVNTSMYRACWAANPPHLKNLLALVDEPHGQGQQVRIAQVKRVYV